MENIPVFTLSSGRDANSRGKIIRKFTESQVPCLLILQTQSAAYGLTLTVANVVVLFEVGLDISAEVQAVGRLLRTGQERKVEIITYVSVCDEFSTVEQRVISLREMQGMTGYVGDKFDISRSISMEEDNGDRKTFDSLTKYRHLLNFNVVKEVNESEDFNF